MSVLDRIKADQLQARRDRNMVIANLLGTLIGQCQTMAKTGKEEHVLSDADVIGVARSFVNRNAEMRSLLDGKPGHDDDIAMLEYEDAKLQTYLPALMTEAEITALIRRLHGEGNKLGEIMAYLKANHPGQYEPRQAAQIVKGIAA